MKKKLIIASILSLISLFPSAEVTLAHVETVVMKMSDKSFTPKDITIHLGSTIIFKNIGVEDRWPASNIHPTHGIYSEFDPQRSIFRGEEWEFTFDKAGVWKYHDHLNPQITGTITVTSEEDPDIEEVKSSQSIVQKILSPLKYIYGKIISFFKNKGVATRSESNYANISIETKEIFKDKDALNSYIKEFGPKKTIQYLNTLSAEFGSCHEPAHTAGRLTYELMGDRAFKECSAECHSGCYHGATEAYFKDHGTKNLSKNLNTLCGDELNGFFSHQCIHGIGHGLMAWANYEIHEALKSCDLLDRGQDSCWTGVFMENIVGGLTDKSSGHFTKYLSDDPQYPCDVVDNKYKGSCYFLQTSRMVQLFNYDFSKVASACLKAPEGFRRECFLSMGRDVGGVSGKNTTLAIKNCRSAPEGDYRIDCLDGAIQDTFWDPTGQDDAIGFCKLLTNKKEKDYCYTLIFQRAPQVLPTEKELEVFCNKTEDSYKSLCYQLLK